MSRVSIRASVVVVAASLAMTGCGGGGGSDAEPSTSVATAETTVGATAEPTSDSSPPASDAPTVDTGDSPCATIIDVGDYERIDCAEPHDAELAGFAGTSSDPSDQDELEFETEMIGLCADVVSVLTDRAVSRFGVDIRPVHRPDADGDNVECWATLSTPGALIGSLIDTELEVALGDYTFIADMDPGTCYVEPDQGYDVGVITDCDDADVTQLVAVVTSAVEEYDSDAIVDDGFVLCEQEIADASFELIGVSAYTLVAPYEENWKALDRRSIICLMGLDEEAPAAPDTASAEQPCADGSDDNFAAVDCDQPHGAEFAGMIAPPVDVLPEDPTEATKLIIQACQSTVEAFIGRDLTKPGMGLGFALDSGLGEPITEDIPCFVNTNTDDALIGRIADLGLDGALTRLIVADQEPGTCFLLADDSFALAGAAECSEPGALMFIGNITLDDGPFPGADAIRELRAVVCGDLLADSGLAADPATVSGTFPSETDWDNLDRRNLACDATPL